MSKKTHNCPDGTVYTWEARVENPKSCPRCKARLDKKWSEDKLLSFWEKIKKELREEREGEK